MKVLVIQGFLAMRTDSSKSCKACLGVLLEPPGPRFAPLPATPRASGEGDRFPAATPEAVPVHDWQKEELARRKANLVKNIEKALQSTGGNYTQAARLLGISRDTLRYRMKKFKISKPS